MSPGNETQTDTALTGGSVADLDPEAIRGLRDLVGDDPDVLADLIDAFLEEAPARLDELRSGTVAGDATLVERAAHTLKSNALTFGARVLGDLCQQLETAARGGRLDEAELLAGRIGAEWDGVRPALVVLRSEATA